MWHVLVSTGSESLVEEIRAAGPSDAVVLSARGVEATLELLGRSSRVDAVVTDDPEVERAIRDELFGALPVVLLERSEGQAAGPLGSAAWEKVARALQFPGAAPP
jgi:hypothetical protein